MAALLLAEVPDADFEELAEEVAAFAEAVAAVALEDFELTEDWLPELWLLTTPPATWDWEPDEVSFELSW